MKNKKAIIIIIAVVALAAIWYFFFRTPTETASDGTTSNVILPSPSVTPTPPLFQTATSTSQTLAVQNPSNGPTVTAESIIYPWFEQLNAANKAYAYAKYPSLSASDKANLATVIGWYWDKGIAPPGDLTNWWVAFSQSSGINNQ